MQAVRANPASLGPAIAFRGAGAGGQLGPFQAGKLASHGNSLVLARVITRDNGAFLCPFFPQQPRQASSVDIADPDHAIGFQIADQTVVAAPVARRARHFPNDQARSLYTCGFDTFTIGAGIAHMRIGLSHHLLLIRRIRQDFLIARPGGIEDHLADCTTGGADSATTKDTTVFERKQSLWAQWNLQTLDWELGRTLLV